MISISPPRALETNDKNSKIYSRLFCFLFFCLVLKCLYTGEDEEGQEQQMPNCFDYFMHILCVFWKILFACIPPTEYWNGWACFIVSISVIGFLTAIIGDLASHFGCTVGLRDTVTAVVFVALGTSLPGEWFYLWKGELSHFIDIWRHIVWCKAM